MDYEQRRTHRKARRDAARVDSALEAVPTLAANQFRGSISARLTEVQNAIRESEDADRRVPEAEAVRKSAEEELDRILNATIVILVARGVQVTDPHENDGSRTPPVIARDLLDWLRSEQGYALLEETLEGALERLEAATVRENRALEEQLTACSRVYSAHSELFKVLNDASGYIKVATERNSVARQRLKLRRKSAKQRELES